MTKKLMFLTIMAVCLLGSQAFADQCGALGDAPGCNLLITVNANGSVTVTVGTGGTNWYDGVEDSLIGVQNNWNQTVTSLNLSSSTVDIFGFDNDGAFGPNCLTSSNGHPAPCGTGGSATWEYYNGPNTTFGNINGTKNAGTVFFTGGIAIGGSSEFSLEGNPGVSGLSGGGVNTPTPEPGSMMLFGSGLIGLASIARRKLRM